MARAAVALRLLEVVDVDVSAFRRPGDDLIPLDGLDTAEVVVVEDADRPDQDVWNSLGYYRTGTRQETLLVQFIVIFIPDCCALVA